jgi:hypothetical protein
MANFIFHRHHRQERNLRCAANETGKPETLPADTNPFDIRRGCDLATQVAHTHTGWQEMVRIDQIAGTR